MGRAPQEAQVWAGKAFLSGAGPAPLPWLPLRSLPTSLQGWVFNVVPWLVAIPASMFSGFLSDWLISQGEHGEQGLARSHTWA